MLLALRKGRYDADKKIKGCKRSICVDILGYLLGSHIVASDMPEHTRAKALLELVR